MREVMTKSMARNIFYGGSLFFIVIFVGLSVHSHNYIVTTSTDAAGLTEGVARGKRVWEVNACINCHTLHGEGAYFAPEVGNVMTRWAVLDDPAFFIFGFKRDSAGQQASVDLGQYDIHGEIAWRQPASAFAPRLFTGASEHHLKHRPTRSVEDRPLVRPAHARQRECRAIEDKGRSQGFEDRFGKLL